MVVLLPIDAPVASVSLYSRVVPFLNHRNEEQPGPELLYSFWVTEELSSFTFFPASPDELLLQANNIYYGRGIVYFI